MSATNLKPHAMRVSANFEPLLDIVETALRCRHELTAAQGMFDQNDERRAMLSGEVALYNAIIDLARSHLGVQGFFLDMPKSRISGGQRPDVTLRPTIRKAEPASATNIIAEQMRVDSDMAKHGQPPVI